MKQYISTSEAAKLAGVGVSSIKRWVDEERVQSIRTPGGHRRVEKKDFDRFLQNGRTRDANAKATTNGRVSANVQANGDGTTPSSAANEKTGHVWADRILSLDVFGLQAELLRSRGQLGTWFQVMDEVGQGVREVGYRWSKGEIDIAEEHISSERLLRALAAIHDSVPVSPDSPTCLLSCVEGESHTIGLALLQVCLREAGWATTWVGASLPMDVLCAVVEKNHPQMVALSASSAFEDQVFLSKQTFRMASLCESKGIKLLLGGRGPWPEIREDWRNRHIGVQSSDFHGVYEFAREVAA